MRFAGKEEHVVGQEPGIELPLALRAVNTLDWSEYLAVLRDVERELHVVGIRGGIGVKRVFGCQLYVGVGCGDGGQAVEEQLYHRFGFWMSLS